MQTFVSKRENTYDSENHTRPENRDPKSVWSVRGVPHDARVAANKAAELTGIPVGEWLGRLIQAHAGEEIKATRALGKTLDQLAEDMAEQMRLQTGVIQGMTARLDALEQQRQVGFFARLFGRSQAVEQQGTDQPKPADPHS